MDFEVLLPFEKGSLQVFGSIFYVFMCCAEGKVDGFPPSKCRCWWGIVGRVFVFVSVRLVSVFGL